MHAATGQVVKYSYHSTVDLYYDAIIKPDIRECFPPYLKMQLGCNFIHPSLYETSRLLCGLY